MSTDATDGATAENASDTGAGGTDPLERAADEGQLPGTDDDAVDEGTTDSDRPDSAEDDAVASGVDEDTEGLDGGDERDFDGGAAIPGNEV